jgi:hypothetical protein
MSTKKKTTFKGILKSVLVSATISVILLLAAYYLLGNGYSRILENQLLQANSEIYQHVVNAGAAAVEYEKLEIAFQENESDRAKITQDLKESRESNKKLESTINKMESEFNPETTGIDLLGCKYKLLKLLRISEKKSKLIAGYKESERKADNKIKSLESGLETCEKQKVVLKLSADEYAAALKVCQTKKTEAYEKEIKRLNALLKIKKYGGIIVAVVVVAATAILR